jgi:3'-5' exoribonuclease
MKPVFVNSLTADQTITSFFLVAEKETRTTREGKPYLRLELADRTGSIEARMWEGFEAAAESIARDSFVKVQARVETYRGRLQLNIERLRRAEPEEIELADFFPHTTHDVEALYGRLMEIVAAMTNPHLKALLERLLGDPDLAAKLKRAPAAKSIHHAYLGGLLEHIVSLCELCRAVAPRYPEINLDLLLAGAILHDIGKIEELSYDGSFGYTTEGLLLGHIVQGLALVRRRIDSVENFPPELRVAVEHMIVSHHGQYEFGSPRLPMFPEALLLHYLDDLDSKMAAMRATLEAEPGEGGWTSWNAALERRLLRLPEYLAARAVPDEAPEVAPAAAPEAHHAAKKSAD